MSIVPAVILFVFVWLIGPVCEELIYRGLLWGALERLPCTIRLLSMST